MVSFDKQKWSRFHFYHILKTAIPFACQISGFSLPIQMQVFTGPGLCQTGIEGSSASQKSMGNRPASASKCLAQPRCTVGTMYRRHDVP